MHDNHQPNVLYLWQMWDGLIEFCAHFYAPVKLLYVDEDYSSQQG